jgi:hypothetical protein
MESQFITDDKGNKISIVIPIEEYQRMMEELEEFHDIKLFDEVKSRNEKTQPLEEYVRKRKNPVRQGV